MDLLAIPNAPLDTLRRPMHDLRISVTDRCNLRCPYCMPADLYTEQYNFLPRESLLTFEEIERIARITARLGVKKLRLTGGEPLLRRDLPLLVEKLAQINGIEDIALTTNGLLLRRHARDLRAAGLHRITISVDAINDSTYQKMSGGRGSVVEVLDGIEGAREAGFNNIKLNCVVIRGINEHAVVELAARFKGTGIVVRYIEFMDVGTLNQWKLDSVVPAREIVSQIREQFPANPVDPSYRGEVARRYAYDDGSGEFGIISSVTQPFCGDCSRLRMSAEGSLYTCLFSASGHDLRAPLRSGISDSELEDLVRNIWRARSDRYSEIRAAAPAQRERVEMYHVGG